MRKEYNKFLIKSIIKNKFAAVTFVVMAFAICSQYLNSDTVVIMSFWASLFACFGVSKTNSVYGYYAGMISLFLFIVAFSIFILSWNNFNGLQFLYIFSFVMSIFSIVADATKEYNLNCNICRYKF